MEIVHGGDHGDGDGDSLIACGPIGPWRFQAVMMVHDMTCLVRPGTGRVSGCAGLHRVARKSWVCEPSLGQADGAMAAAAVGCRRYIQHRAPPRPGDRGRKPVVWTHAALLPETETKSEEWQDVTRSVRACELCMYRY